MKKIVTFIISLLLILSVFSVEETEKEKICKEAVLALPMLRDQLKNDSVLIMSLAKLIDNQKKAIENFLKNELNVVFTYEKGVYYVNINGKIVSYSLKSDLTVGSNGEYTFAQTYSYVFKDQLLNNRPFDYIPNIFKLGVSVSYNKEISEAILDPILLYEVFSFDKLFHIYGFSLNLNVGLQNVGGSLGYQFIETKLFKNTSVLLGYGYNFKERFFAPYLGLSLNF